MRATGRGVTCLLTDVWVTGLHRGIREKVHMLPAHSGVRLGECSCDDFAMHRFQPRVRLDECDPPERSAFMAKPLLRRHSSPR